MSNLVILESQGKVKTVKKYLGDNYTVMASAGHLWDLPKSQLGVDIENGFTPKYITIRGRAEIINKLKKEAKNSDKIYLATDPDREGEAISWHLATLLGLTDAPVRVTFNEITKNAVKQGIKNPRRIDMNLVNAQQARRILDRIVGYKLSPFLWKKIRKGLSAGRVQSVVTRLIVDREKEITDFVPKEYWTVEARLAKKSKGVFTAKFFGDAGGKIELPNEEAAKKILAATENAEFTVAALKYGDRVKSPAPPFITSTLQQEASKRLNFQSYRTMQVAQGLYEGVDIGQKGATGLITYMRTDSTRVSSEAQAAAGKYIGGAYGSEYVLDKPREYKTKSNAQDAHEAIRPSDVENTPESIKKYLTADQYKLYKLIWERFLCSQMASAILDTVQADIEAGGYIFKASGYTVKFDGFMKLLGRETSNGDGDGEGQEGETNLPKLEEGEKLILKKLSDAQHFTQPPPRYNEASLIKELEENGIGRPSTYSPTITTIISRGYVVREGKNFVPTELGQITTELMRNHFTDIVDTEFTARMEARLDEIEDGKNSLVGTLEAFYGGFARTMEKAEQELGDVHIKIPDVVSDVICENCGKNMVVKNGKFNQFLACPGFPECRNTKPLLQRTGAACPKCGADVVVKKTKKGVRFYTCEKNKECGFITWDEPAKEPCPKCGKALFKKQRERAFYCADEGCGYRAKQ